MISLALEVFPNGRGEVESPANIIIINLGLVPMMIRARAMIETGETDQNGDPVLKAKYTSTHSLRHFYASWCINRPEDGGLGDNK